MATAWKMKMIGCVVRRIPRYLPRGSGVGGGGSVPCCRVLARGDVAIFSCQTITQCFTAAGMGLLNAYGAWKEPMARHVRSGKSGCQISGGAVENY